jgi:hypothetical protein
VPQRCIAVHGCKINAGCSFSRDLCHRLDNKFALPVMQSRSEINA